MAMAPAVSIELTTEERARLEAWARRRTSVQALAARARIVFLAGDVNDRSEAVAGWSQSGPRALTGAMVATRSKTGVWLAPRQISNATVTAYLGDLAITDDGQLSRAGVRAR